MSRQERLSRILEIVVEKGSVEVEDVANSLKVSAATIRRDFDSLAKKQLLSRTHGGAVATGGSLGLPLTYKVAKEDEVKQRIAEAAAEMVSRHDIIGINGGTTTTAVARAIVARSEFAPGDPSELQPALTVVTNAVNIDIAFLGVEAIDSVIGAAARHEDEARVKRQIAARARKIVVVTDSSKFAKSAFASIRPISEIDVLITDDGIDPKIVKDFRALGVEIVIV